MEGFTVKIGWLLGWAVPETWFAPLARAAWPNADHVFVASTRIALTHLEARGPFEWIVGYSLGTQLLLQEAERVSRWGQVALLAPIFAFPREAELGGRVAKTQVRQLARWLRRDPLAALTDFYRQAGLDVPAELEPRMALEDLLWGLERLENGNVPPSLPTGWRAWCGANDPLLDADRLRSLEPRVQSVGAGTHHPSALLRAFAQGAMGAVVHRAS